MSVPSQSGRSDQYVGPFKYNRNKGIGKHLIPPSLNRSSNVPQLKSVRNTHGRFGKVVDFPAKKRFSKSKSSIKLTQIKIPICFREYLEALNKDVLKVGCWVENMAGYSEMGESYK